MSLRSKAFVILLAANAASPAFAQDVDVADAPVGVAEETVFDGDYLTVGIGAAYGPSYSGSDDYRVFVLPVVQGSLGGIDIDPRPAGLALDFIPDSDEGPNFSFGPSFRLNRDRAEIDEIDDEVVEAFGELDTAIEIGPSVGVSFPKVLNPFDSLTFTTDVLWDVAGAHDGMTISPNVTYFTPLSRAIAGSLTLGANYVDDDFADYYYSVDPIQTLVPLPEDETLPAFEADGGFESLSATVLLGFDLNGDVTDGGLALVAMGGYSRLLGDAADSPFTSVRGDADQFLAVLGIGYTF